MESDVFRIRKVILIRAIYFMSIGLASILFFNFLPSDPISYISMTIFIITHFAIGIIDLSVAAQFYSSKKKATDVANSIILFYSSVSCYFCMGIMVVALFVFIINFALLIFMMVHLIITVILISMTTSALGVLDDIAEPIRARPIQCSNCGYTFESAKHRCPKCKTYWITDPDQIDTKNKDIIFQIGLQFYNNKELEKARVTFKKITKLDKKHAAAWYNVACCSSVLGKLKKALEALKKAIEIEKEWRDKAKDDKDFDSIRDTVEFNEMV
jgi:tetratricopeptide (TPR) repeat protein